MILVEELPNRNCFGVNSVNFLCVMVHEVGRSEVDGVCDSSPPTFEGKLRVGEGHRRACNIACSQGTWNSWRRRRPARSRQQQRGCVSLSHRILPMLRTSVLVSSAPSSENTRRGRVFETETGPQNWDTQWKATLVAH